MANNLKRDRASGGKLLKLTHPSDLMLRKVPPPYPYLVLNRKYGFNCLGCFGILIR